MEMKYAELEWSRAVASKHCLEMTENDTLHSYYDWLSTRIMN